MWEEVVWTSERTFQVVIDPDRFLALLLFQRDDTEPDRVTMTIGGGKGVSKPATIGLLRMVADQIEQDLIDQ